MPMIAQWDINNECNLNCKHCRVAEKNDQEKLSLEETKRLLAQCQKNGITKLNLSGGEPFLRNDIFEILEEAKIFEDIVITTNGTLLTEEKCKKIAQYPNVKLSISLDGMRETHDSFRRKKGSFDKVIQLLPLLKKYQIPYAIKYTLSKETKQDVKEVLHLIASKGCREFNSRRVIVSGNAEENMLITKEEYIQSIQEIIRECEKLQIQFRTGDPVLIPIFPEIFGIDLKKDNLKQIYAGCQAGDEIIYIDYKGYVGACSYIPTMADNIMQKDLKTILEKNKLFVNLRNYKENLKGKCAECSYKSICGGCRATALALKGSLLEEDPLCLV